MNDSKKSGLIKLLRKRDELIQIFVQLDESFWIVIRSLVTIIWLVTMSYTQIMITIVIIRYINITTSYMVMLIDIITDWYHSISHR